MNLGFIYYYFLKKYYERFILITVLIGLDGFEAACFEIYFFIYRFPLFVGIEPTGTMSKPLTTLIKIKGTLAVSA